MSVSKKTTCNLVLEFYQAPGQQLTKFEEPADIVAHPCGEYVLNELQSGVSAVQVRKVLFEDYLVETTAARVVSLGTSSRSKSGIASTAKRTMGASPSIGSERTISRACLER